MPKPASNHEEPKRYVLPGFPGVELHSPGCTCVSCEPHAVGCGCEACKFRAEIEELRSFRDALISKALAALDAKLDRLVTMMAAQNHGYLRFPQKPWLEEPGNEFREQPCNQAWQVFVQHGPRQEARDGT